MEGNLLTRPYTIILGAFSFSYCETSRKFVDSSKFNCDQLQLQRQTYRVLFLLTLLRTLGLRSGRVVRLVVLLMACFAPPTLSTLSPRPPSHSPGRLFSAHSAVVLRPGYGGPM